MEKRKQIVFLEAYATPMMYKIARIFRKKSYEVILIRLLKPNSNADFYNSAYDKIIDINLVFKKELKNLPLIISSLSFSSFVKILSLKPYVIFSRATPSWPTALLRLIFRKTPLIYFPYDIRAHYAPTPEIARKERGISRFEMRCEKFCFEKCDGIMHKGAPDELKPLDKIIKNLKLVKHQLCFHPYCSEEFIIPFNKNKLSKKDKKLHLVFLGTAGAGREFDNYVRLFEKSKKILEKNIHFHVYISPNTVSTKQINEDAKIEELRKEFMEKYKNDPALKYFHIHNPLNPKEIVKEISKYDFSFWPVVEYKEYDLEPRFAMANKISTDFEAGIPFIYTEAVTFIDKLMKSYGISLPFKSEDVYKEKDIVKKIKKINYKELEKKIEKIRRDFLMEKQFPRLERFMKKVVASKKY